MTTAGKSHELLIEGPFEREGYPVWEDRLGDVEIRFVGRGPAGGRDEVLARIGEPDLPVAWAKQIHSARVLPALSPGECGEGDALTTDRPGLALAVVTADCVPVLLAGPSGIAAVHAGWRGIASGVIPATLSALGNPAGWTAWIGPAIGPCCYEVGEDVAEQIAAASTSGAVVPYPGGSPHLDLLRAATHQLRAAGVADVTALTLCTRCETEKLSSYRREGKGAGRNLAFIWRRG
ncbi:MAG: purine-nucleoside/S-methyl-5-thioadenosine phosphorylase / adenosine deaminase [Acidobacteriota bacterium]|nr:purine-nucleoside/S-methyl-5-thioadenosine phosphorylase / adenosine deaminase [Acidobacteriota bacterium]